MKIPVLPWVRIGLFLSSIWFFFAPGAFPGDGMRKYSTPAVRLYTDADKDEANRLVADLEFFSRYIDDFFMGFGMTQRKENPLRCRIFRRDEDFLDDRRKRDVPGYAGAFFSPNDNCIIAPLSGGESQLLHECTHVILRRYFNDLPIWLDEGFATYFQGFEFDRHGYLITACGRESLFTRFKLLERNGTLMDWDQLLRYGERGVSTDDLERDFANTSVVYAQSWGLVFFYLHGGEAAREKFGTFLKGMHTGREQVKFLAEDFASRRDAFFDFFEKDRMAVCKLYRKAEALRKAGGPEDSLNSLLALLELEPDNLAAVRLAAEATFDTARYESSREFWLTLSEDRPQDEVPVRMICRCLTELGRARQDADLLAEAVKTGMQCVKMSGHHDPDCLAALARAYFESGRVREALDAMRNALRYPCDDRAELEDLERAYSRELLRR